MIATAAALIPADRFARIVAALVRQFAGLVVDAEWAFGLVEGWDVTAWVPRDGHLMLSLCPVEQDGRTGEAVHCVTLVPGEYRAHEVRSGDRSIGEAHDLAAAMSIALDHVTLPLRAATQGDHDAFAV